MTRIPTFWDRRRAAVEAETEANAAAQQAALELHEQEALAEKSDEEILAELELPDPDTLTKGDDFAAFMAKAVPEHLRKRALRKLWRSNPVLACVDGLNDYDDDYLAGSYGNAPIQTNYQVGKGLLAHVLKVAQAEEFNTDDQALLDKEDKSAQDEIGEDPVATIKMPAPDVALDKELAPQDMDDGRPRRMVFHFDGNTS
ncbi:DUF3306 domain-containing protein [Roseovarius arcticus]|uniref:DUF3306 domain-containing protein n=1 Tax=Roseovarius arcticus TaxID=2547404 RepID=UPI001110E38D|nr:DUF3306 domain-containing protein [Roseovarius arcticus]